MKKQFILSFTAILLSGCGTKVSDPAAPATPAVTSEASECTTNTTYATPVIVTGTANFFKRGLNVSTLATEVTEITLAGPITSALPIKFAEVRVLDSAGNVIQCGKTNSVGALKALDGSSNLNISNIAGNYTVQVLSRANHAMAVSGGKPAFQFYTSVKADIYSNAVYTLAQTVTSTGSGSVNANALTAFARESESAEVNGGAFNIYNDLIVSYEYLAAQTGLSNLTCLNPKLNVFWKVGFNPAQYAYPSADPATLGTLSFYVRGENELYINGGKLGNITSEDTDHFDDAVIIHELGHHLEYACGTMDSPGGTHFGLYRTDARLAWSEGFGNFFGAHIIRNNTAAINPNLPAQVTTTNGWLYYLDTMGYTDGAVTTGNEYIRIKLTKPGNNPEMVSTSNGTRYYDKVNATANPGEGHFRETSVARALFKITNSCTTGCTGTIHFPNMWSAFEKFTANGMGNALYPFRSSARFYNRLAAVFGGAMPTEIDNVLNNDEAQQREVNAAFTVGGARVHVPYGIKLVAGSTCNLKIQPRADSGLDSNFQSDQRYSNHFYTVDLASLPGVTEIRLNATKVTGTTVDIDSILYKEDYSFDEDCAAYAANSTCAAPQKTVSADMVKYNRSLGNGIKTLSSLSSLNASAKYLLNIRAYTTNIAVSSATEYSYILTDQNGSVLCPASPF